MTGIFDEDACYNQKIFEKHGRVSGTNPFLNPGAKDWLRKHGRILVGYADDAMPFSGRDTATGELTGTLRDRIARAGSRIVNSGISFGAVPYASAAEALGALEERRSGCRVSGESGAP